MPLSLQNGSSRLVATISTKRIQTVCGGATTEQNSDGHLVATLAGMICCLLLAVSCSSSDAIDEDAGTDTVDDVSDVSDVADMPRLLDPTRLAAGFGHTCLIRDDQSVICWGLGWQPDVFEGEGDHDQADPPDGAFVDITAGRFHTCGIRDDLTVECWGMGLDDTSAEQPEAYDYDQSIAPDGSFLAVSAGATTTCGIRVGGEVICWGDISGNVLGTGAFERISVGFVHVCGILESGEIRCYGTGDDPERVENANDFNQASPPEGRYASVTAGTFHTCALDDEGVATCWGLGTRAAQEHDGWDHDQARPPELQFSHIDAGSYHTCGVVQGSLAVVCWGLGATSEEEWSLSDYDQSIPPDGQFESVSAAWMSTCGLNTSGDPQCWGWNGLGQVESFSRYGSQGCNREDYASFERYECSPLCQTGCTEGKSCTLGSGSGFTIPATRCIEPGPQDLGEECPRPLCQSGLSCHYDVRLGHGFCRHVCRVDQGNTDCPPDHRCNEHSSGVVGYCDPLAGGSG
jgi:alpha-tubulin suppressor-like RCC1 family protein